MYASRLFIRCMLFKVVRRTYFTKNPYIQKYLLEHRDIFLTPLTVVSSRFSKSFSGALLDVWPYIIDKNNKVVEPDEIFHCDRKYKAFSLNFRPLFTEGMEIVSSITQEKGLETTKDVRYSNMQKCVQNLDDFFKNIEFHEDCLSGLSLLGGYGYNNMEITALLVNHLFSPLVSNDHERCSSSISKDLKFKIKSCPCTKCNSKIWYGDSNFGSKYLWYGRPDIMLYPVGGGAMAVAIDKGGFGIVKDGSKEMNYSDIIDVKCTEEQLGDLTDVSQVASQAITFSLYQRKVQSFIEWMEEYPTTTLIPTILTSTQHFYVYFYDAENDVFLRNAGRPIPIFQRGAFDQYTKKLDLNSVVQLWMMINHLLLQPRLSPKQLHILKGTCGMQKKIETLNLKEKIEETMDAGYFWAGQYPDRLNESRPDPFSKLEVMDIAY